MAKLYSHPATGQLSGTIGDLVFVRSKTGRVVVRQRPVRTGERKPGELASQQQFALAVLYAKAVWATQPELKSKYQAEARKKGRQGFHLAKADFRRPPQVPEIDLKGYSGRPGEPIRIVAKDDFEVQAVEIWIRDLSGGVIEQGAAVSENGAWIYRPQAQVPAGQTVTIQVTAKDDPGHSASKQVDHACGPRSG